MSASQPHPFPFVASAAKAAAARTAPRAEEQKTRRGGAAAPVAAAAPSIFEDDGSLNLDNVAQAKARCSRAQKEAADEAEADFLASAQSRVGHRARGTARGQQLEDAEDAEDALSPEEHAARARTAWMTLAGISRSVLGSPSPSRVPRPPAATTARSGASDDDEAPHARGPAGMMRERAAAERWLANIDARVTRPKRGPAPAAAAPSVARFADDDA
jgi:hypothetical protein